MKTILTITLLFTCVLGFGQQQVFKSPNKGDTIYYDPSNPPQVFKGGMEYLLEQTTDTIHFTSVQPATLNQVSIVLQTLSTADTVYLDWGEDAVVKVCGITDQTITSDYGTNSTTYNIKLYGDLSKLTKFSISNELTVQGIQSSELQACSGLTYLYLNNLGTTGHSINSDHLKNMSLTTLYLSGLGTTGHSINSDHLKNMSLTYLYLRNIGATGHSINSDHLKNMSLTILTLSNIGTSGHLINSDHLKNMPLTTLNLRDIGTSGHSINSDHLKNMPLTTLYLNNIGTSSLTGSIADLKVNLTTLSIINCGTGMGITGTMKAWNADITLTSGYSTASVDGFLNAYAAVAPSSAKTIDLKGTGEGVANENRSSASDAAVLTLQGLLKTVKTNP